MEHTLANKIRELRKKKKLTQYELADIIGVGKGNIGHYEKGISLPAIENLIKLANFFEVSIDELVGNTPPNSNSNSIESSSKGNLLIPIRIQSSYPDSIDFTKTDILPEYLHIPGEIGKIRTFEINGDSMVPVLFPGDLAVSKKISQFDEIRSRVIYTIVSPLYGVIHRYIERDKQELILISEDSINSPIIKCDEKDIIEIWEITARITKQLLHPKHYFNEKNNR